MPYHLPISRQRQHELLVSLIEYALADLGGSLRMQTVCHCGIKEQKSKHTISIPPCHASYSKQTFPVSSLQITLKVHPSNPLQPVHHNTLTQIPRTTHPKVFSSRYKPKPKHPSQPPNKPSKPKKMESVVSKIKGYVLHRRILCKLFDPDPKKLAKSLLALEVFSDLTITCGDKEWKVHKNLLWIQSDYFRKLLDGDFKVRQEHEEKRKDTQPGRRPMNPRKIKPS
jgi:hypothetical protein